MDSGRILVGFWEDSRFWEDSGVILRILTGFWLDSGRILGSGPVLVPVRFQGPKKCQKCSTVVNRAQGHLPAAAGTRFGGHLGSPYLTLLEPYSVPLLGKKTANREEVRAPRAGLGFARKLHQCPSRSSNKLRAV